MCWLKYWPAEGASSSSEWMCSGTWKKRYYCAKTRNARLSAIKTFFRFLEYREPSCIDDARRVHAIPYKKTDEQLVDYLTRDEMQALLDAPDPTREMASVTAPCFTWGSRQACGSPSSSACG